jgi:two-component system phosphate regulon sensor histidine kinase PhoR
MEEVFEDVVGDLRQQLDRKGQAVRIRVHPSAHTICTDPHALHDALHNLLENAVIYSSAGGGITLTAAGDGDQIVIAVEDEGPGIPAADLARVFERFYRVDRARSRESGGTGLGLAIVKHLVERMEGTVTADNRAEGGAVFTIRLPVKRFTCA